ncbi:MAG TPA: OmpA family protein [Ginsengibacter sp.]|nr:OmpA family protein [Ginsengibacter sp.]
MIAKYSKLILLLIALSWSTESAYSQILKKVKERVKETVENKVVNKAGEAAENSMDKMEEKAKGKSSSDKKNREGNENEEEYAKPESGKSEAVIAQKPEQSTLTDYSNYDFVTGSNIIFYYDLAGEKDAEIPGRMMIDEGAGEVQTFRGEKVLFVPSPGQLWMRPAMKESSYLPSQFTFEFDVLSNGVGGSTAGTSRITLYFRSADQDKMGGSTVVLASLQGISGDEGFYGFEAMDESGNVSGTGFHAFPAKANRQAMDNWRHVAVYVNKNIAKFYIDQHRIGILNQVLPGKATNLSIEVSNPEQPVMFKNFRLAAGGTDAYEKVITDGKFISYGIQFDVNKSLLKPESMGAINEVVKMLKSYPELKLEIGGHTDSDGSAERNNTLSQERANAVKKQMVSMGIDAARLTTKGYGSSKPIAENNSVENKARNRRVEFVRK